MAVKIPLSKGRFALVDDADAATVMEHRWYAVKGGNTFYAARWDGSSAIVMHRQILGFPQSPIDHSDGDGLNNTRGNLRACLHKENIRNQRKRKSPCSSIFKGVRRRGKKWLVEIEQNGERLYLGAFESEISAARQYDQAARTFFGKFARTNEMLGLFERSVDVTRNKAA